MRKRNNQINIRLYDAELDKLNKKVAKSGMPREKFLRNLIAGAEIKPTPPVDFANLIREVRRLGGSPSLNPSAISLLRIMSIVLLVKVPLI